MPAGSHFFYHRSRPVCRWTTPVSPRLAWLISASRWPISRWVGEQKPSRLAYERDSRNGELTCSRQRRLQVQVRLRHGLGPGPRDAYVVWAGLSPVVTWKNLDWTVTQLTTIHNWVPSGMYAPVPRDIVTAETCNRCHDPLALHGSRLVCLQPPATSATIPDWKQLALTS